MWSLSTEPVIGRHILLSSPPVLFSFVTSSLFPPTLPYPTIQEHVEESARNRKPVLQRFANFSRIGWKISKRPVDKSTEDMERSRYSTLLHATALRNSTPIYATLRNSILLYATLSNSAQLYATALYNTSPLLLTTIQLVFKVNKILTQI